MVTNRRYHLRKLKPEEMKKRRGFLCLDCRVDTGKIGEYYMVHDEIWIAAVDKTRRGMLCVGCLEKRIGRRLVAEDFTDCHLNKYGPAKGWSQRLADRLGNLV